MQHVVGRRAAEHDVELRESEDKAIGTIDQYDVGLVAELLGQPAREFEAAKACTSYHHTHPGSLEPADDPD